MSNQRECLRINDVVEWLKVSARTVYRLIAEGELVKVKVRGGDRAKQKSTR